MHLQLVSPLGFQLADGGRNVTGEDGRVRPARFGERGRCHVLGLRVQRLPDRVVTRIWPRSPGAGEDLVGPPAEQERVGTLVDLVHGRPGFVVEVGPSAALESAAVVLLRPAGSCITPSTETCVVVVSFMVAVPFSLSLSLAGWLT